MIYNTNKGALSWHYHDIYNTEKGAELVITITDEL